MPLELKDLLSQKNLVVPDEGLTFGREGGDANVQLRDTGVSKRHARVFGENGAWFLEDLGSSNGTWLQKERIKDATELLPGDVFQLSQAKFEVLQVIAGEGDPEATGAAPQRSATEAEMPADEEQENEPTPKPMPAAAPAKAAPAKAAPVKEASVSKSKPAPAPAAGKKADPKSKRGEAATAIGPESPAPDAGADGKAAGDAKGVGYFFIAVPKAIAYYLARIPLMIVNPVGSIRKGISEQPAEPMQRMELIAYALPVNILSALFGALGAVIVTLVATHSIGSAIGALLGSIVSVIIAVVVSGISGWFWHPVFNWIITKLKGHSDERERTNLFLMVNTATAILTLPAFLAQVLSLVHLPVIGVIPPVLSLAGTVVMLFIWFNWMKHFEVIKWVPIVILVLGALAALGTIPSILHGITGGGGGVTVASGGDFEAQAEALKKAAEEAQKAGEAAQADAQKQLAKAGEETKVAVAAADKEVKKAEKGAEKAADKAADKAEKAAEKTAEKAPEKGAEAEKAAAPPAKVDAPAVAAGGGYGTWHSKLDAIEKRVTDDPTVLSKSTPIKDLYRDLEDDVFEIESKYQKATAKKPSERKLNEHLKDAEMYEKTEKKTIEIYGKLFK